MNLAWFIFLIDLSGNIHDLLTILFFVCLGGLIIISCILFISIANYNSYSKSEKIKIKTLKKYVRLCILLASCFGLLSLVCPSTKTLATMYVLPKIANNEDIQHTVNDNLKSLRFLSERWLIELMQGNDKKEGK